MGSSLCLHPIDADLDHLDLGVAIEHPACGLHDLAQPCLLSRHHDDAQRGVLPCIVLADFGNGDLVGDQTGDQPLEYPALTLERLDAWDPQIDFDDGSVRLAQVRATSLI